MAEYVRSQQCGRAVSTGFFLLLSCSPAPSSEPICKKEDIRIVNSMREIAQPYHADLDKGGRLFAKWAGLENQYILQLNQGDSDRQISLMRSFLATNPLCTIFNVEPNADTVITPMVETANETGAWIVTNWAHPPGYHPYDGHDQWVAHVAVNSLEAGTSISNLLMDAIGHEGGIVALQGRLDTDPAQKRFTGLQNVLKANPKVTLLDQQTANWDRTASFPIMQTWLSKYGDKIKGVWAANDDMALGALEALRAAGLAGEIPIVGVDGIPEAIAAISRGEMIATVSSDAFYQGSLGLAMGYCVVSGQTPAPKTWPKEKRDFYLKLLVITKNNAARLMKEPELTSYVDTWKCDGLWSRSIGVAP